MVILPSARVDGETAAKDIQTIDPSGIVIQLQRQNPTRLVQHGHQ